MNVSKVAAYCESVRFSLITFQETTDSGIPSTLIRDRAKTNRRMIKTFVQV